MPKSLRRFSIPLLLSTASLVMASTDAAVAEISGEAKTRGQNAPSWVTDIDEGSPCEMVDLGPGGRPGTAASNRVDSAFVLIVTRRSGVSCGKARSVAKTTWLAGRGGGLKWRRDHGWTSTQTAAFAYQFTGRANGRRITFQALR